MGQGESFSVVNCAICSPFFGQGFYEGHLWVGGKIVALAVLELYLACWQPLSRDVPRGMLVLDDLGYGLGTLCWAGRPRKAYCVLFLPRIGGRCPWCRLIQLKAFLTGVEIGIDHTAHKQRLQGLFRAPRSGQNPKLTFTFLFNVLHNIELCSLKVT